jgi:hypothetical protein
MQLRSPDGVSVELRIAGYQFPDYKVHSADVAVRRLQALTKFPHADPKKLARDWDANWLQVCGNITLADGKTWAFEQPCLTTWDARELGSWLREVPAGTVPPSGTDEPGQFLEFLEPNIAFSLEERTADRVRIRVHFGVEALPPWLHGGQQEPPPFDYFVLLDVSAQELAQAAEAWMLELAEFPER